MSDVKPLKSEQAPPFLKKTSPRRPRRGALDAHLSGVDLPVSDELEVEISLAGDVLHFSRSGVQPKWLLRLRRGQFLAAAELDLHGCTVAQSRQKLGDFLAEAGAKELRCVRVIHGKGHRSTQHPVLKNKLNLWLRQIPEVLAFCSAPPAGGGAGAVLVLLKRRGTPET